MFFVRYVALIALVSWLGGMLSLVTIAPSVFEVLHASDPERGHWLAGLVLIDVFRQFHILAYVCGGVLFICLFIMKFVGPPPSAFLARAAIVVVMLLLSAYSGLFVSSEIGQIQRQVAGSISDLPAGDARRSRFEELHRTSGMLLFANAGLGFALLLWYARE
jgi:hypothetical protein